MTFNVKEKLVWSLINYLGSANHPEVREADNEGKRRYGLAYPIGARLMSGNTMLHKKFETEIADDIGKEDDFLLNYGYQGMLSIIDSLVDRNDVIVYDAESHACIIDGMRLHLGQRFVFKDDDTESARKELIRANQASLETVMNRIS
jgi:glycine C-acetyltransferase